jgi:hypothetical protein
MLMARRKASSRRRAMASSSGSSVLEFGIKGPPVSDDDRDAVSPGDGRTVHADPRQRTIVVDPDSPTLRIYKPLVRVDPTHEVFTLIGRTAAHMAQFEHVLDQIVKDLIRTKAADCLHLPLQ